MKKQLQQFLKDKVNMTICILQLLAIVFLCLCGVWQFATFLFLILEGLVFVFVGIRTLKQNKKIDREYELANKINIENVDMLKQNKKNNIEKKSNRFSAIIYFLMGITLIFIAII